MRERIYKPVLSPIGDPLRSDVDFNDRGIGGIGGPTATGLRFTSGQYARGTGGDYAQAYRWARVIYAANALPPMAFSFIAGLDSGGGGSWMFGAESNATLTGYTTGRLVTFDGVYSTSTGNPAHIPQSSELGRYTVVDSVIDGTNLLDYRNGRLMRIGVADAKTTWTSANPLAINCRPTGAPPTLQYGDVSVFEIQLSTTVPTAAQIRTYATAPVGTAIPGCTRLFVMADASGATVVDRVGGKSLTLTGSPTPVTISAAPRSMGCLYLRGDSHLSREPGPVEADGVRLPLLSAIDSAGYWVSSYGQTTFATNTTKTYDPLHGGVAGQALGLANGQPSALSQLASNLTTYCSRDGGVLLEFGSNDVYARCVTGLETSASCATNFLADLDTALALVGAHLDAGRPIVITNTLRCSQAASPGATGIQQRGAIDLIYAQLPAWIAARVGTYPGLRLVDWYGQITPTQADADNTAILYDGTHMAAAYRTIAGNLCAAGFLSAA